MLKEESLVMQFSITRLFVVRHFIGAKAFKCIKGFKVLKIQRVILWRNVIIGCFIKVENVRFLLIGNTI